MSEWKPIEISRFVMGLGLGVSAAPGIHWSGDPWWVGWLGFVIVVLAKVWPLPDPPKGPGK